MLRIATSPFVLAAALLLTAGAPSAAVSPAGAPAVAPAAAQAGWAQGSSDLEADPEVRFGILPNGMRYAIKRNATPPGEASLRLRIGAGSLHEAGDQRGIAHFLEHMVLNGTTNVPEGEFVRRLERHGLRFGPDTNASTGFTQTVFKLDLPETDAATVDTALFLLREVADEATLDAASIEAERGIILSEERSRATPGFRTFVDHLAFMMTGQLVPERLPIGRTDVIENAPRERFLEFYSAYYRPERATLVAIGDFDVDEMEARIRTQFESWRGDGIAGGDPDRGLVARRELEARAYVEQGAPDRLSLTWVRPPDLRPDTRAVRADKFADRIALQILNRRLARIAATVSPPPFIAARSSRFDQADSADIVQLSVAVRPGGWREALERIEQEQRRLVEHGVSRVDLDLDIGQLRTNLTTAVARAATRRSAVQANRLIAAIDDGEVFTAPDVDLAIFGETVSSLTRERVETAARFLFQGNGPLLYLSASNAVEGGEQALIGAYRESYSRAVAPLEARHARAWPYTHFGSPGEVVERREIGGGVGATAIRFANGVRLIVKQTAFTDDEILVAVRTGDGRGNIPPGATDPSWALGLGFIRGGLERIGFEDMRDVLASTSFSARAILFEDAFVLHGATRPEDFRTQMEVLAAYVAEPAWDPSGWNRVRSMSDTTHNRYESTPGGVYERDAAALLHSGDRRWATPSREEMAASSIADARVLLEEALAREPIEVIVIGDLSVDDAIEQTAATFGALPARIAEPDTIPPVRFPAGAPEPVRLTHSGRADQGLAMIAWPTTGLYADTRQSRTLDVLASVYRLRLIEKIREEQGATYSPAANQVRSTTFDDFGFLFGRIEAPPATLERFLADAAEIARDLTEHPISADELDRARRPMIESQQRLLSSNSWWRFSLARVQEDPRVAEVIRSQRSDYESVTPASLQQTARRFLRPDTAWKLIIVPQAE